MTQIHSCIVIVFKIKDLVTAQSCKLDGKVYALFESFTSGIEGCAECVCTDAGVECDVTKCQEIAKNRLVPITTYANIKYNDYNNIKDQIAKKYFAEYDPIRLKAIKKALGCNSTDCPKLIDTTDIKYNLLDSVGREYVGRGDKLNKIVFHSADTEVENNSPSQQIIKGRSFFLTMTSNFEITFTKTKNSYSEKGVNYWVYKKKSSITFTQREEQKYTETNKTTMNFPSQNITIAPFTKMNTTFNFFQYEDINNYFLDFEIAANSTLTHLELDANSKVINVTKPLGDFLKKHIGFLSTIKYESETALKLVEIDGKFVLKNMPTIEKLTNFGFDVKFGRVEKLK